MYPTRPPVNPRFSSPPSDELDGLLRQFFRSQLPSPWPEAPQVSCEQKTIATPGKLGHTGFFRPRMRLAVAACVAFLVIGYVGLQSWFPDPKPAPRALHDSQGFASKLKAKN